MLSCIKKLVVLRPKHIHRRIYYERVSQEVLQISQPTQTLPTGAGTQKGNVFTWSTPQYTGRRFE